MFASYSASSELKLGPKPSFCSGWGYKSLKKLIEHRNPKRCGLIIFVTFEPIVSRRYNTDQWEYTKIKNMKLLDGIYDGVHFRKGKLHRLDGPAFILDGNPYFFVHGRAHREEKPFSGTMYRINNRKMPYNGIAKLHSNESTVGYGYIYFYEGNAVHREDGPAYISLDGRHVKQIEDYRMGRRDLPENLNVLRELNRNDKNFFLAAIRKLGDLGIYEVAMWKENGIYHRIDGPAVIVNNSSYQMEKWWLRGKCHRKGGPAVTVKDPDFGTYVEEWHLNGQLHRELDLIEPALISTSNCSSIPQYPVDTRSTCQFIGAKVWYLYGKVHRENGPAVVYPQWDEYFINGKLYKKTFGGETSIEDDDRYSKINLIISGGGSVETRLDPQNYDYVNGLVYGNYSSDSSIKGADQLYGLLTSLAPDRSWNKSEKDIRICTVNGVLHNENEPAVEIGDIKAWYIFGKLHREDAPAYQSASEIEWWRDGKLHRENGPAVVRPGREEWWRNGKLHRENGPAVVVCGREEWWFNGERHREDGPAISGGRNRSKGDKPISKFYYLHGVIYTKKIFYRIYKLREKNRKHKSYKKRNWLHSINMPLGT